MFRFLLFKSSALHLTNTYKNEIGDRQQMPVITLATAIKYYCSTIFFLLCFSRESDSESSGSGPVDLSVLGCGSVAGDSDWDSDLSDSDPSRSSRISAAGNKSARPKRLPAEPGWDLFGETTEPEVLSELFTEQDRNINGKARKVTGVSTSMAGTQAIPTSTQPVTTPMKAAAPVEQSSTTKKVTWQFKPAQRSVCTGSRKEKEKEATSSSLVRFTELGGGENHRPSPSSSSSSSSSPSSSSSG